jgi:hypothetical protein
MPCAGCFMSGKDLEPSEQEVGWAPKACLDGLWKILSPLGFELQIIQPVASLYTDYLTPAFRRQVPSLVTT